MTNNKNNYASELNDPQGIDRSLLEYLKPKSEDRYSKLEAYCDIFSCFAGLRLGDVRALTWNKVFLASDGKTKFVRTIMEKTNKLVNVPLSKEALNCLNEKEDPNEPIFTLPGTPTVCHDIRKWMQNADIKKHISFHCSRHTFATMMLTLGVDIYTTSKLLGHSNVSTTQIYSKIVDEKKVEAVNKVDNLFD